MNPFTFDNIPAPRQSIDANNKFNIFQNGNLIAMEQPGRSGLELRNNTNVRCRTLECSNVLPLRKLAIVLGQTKTLSWTLDALL